jgi:D-3-phosphoglycerate dehydrogenase
MAPRILVTGSELGPRAIEILQTIGATVDLIDGKVTAERLIAELDRSPTEAILLRGNPPLTGEVIAHGLSLKVIAKHGAGVDSVDLAAATAQGVLVMVAGDANAAAVAEHAIALILALGRDIPTLADGVRAGRWDRQGYLGRELRGRTLGVVGFGRIGRRVCQLAGCLGLRCLVLPREPASVDPALGQEVDSLAALLEAADIVSLHVPLTPATQGMIDRAALGLMKPGAILVNTARGALVDETALAEALRDGRLAGAALDTLTVEPPPPGHPLLSAPNLIITPHIAAMTDASVTRMGTMAAENIVAVLTGGPVDRANVVNREAFGGR